MTTSLIARSFHCSQLELFIGAHDNRDIADFQFRAITGLLTYLGLPIGSNTAPSRQCSQLGIAYNTVTMTARPSGHKAHEMIAVLTRLRNGRSVSVPTLCSIIGRCLYFGQTCPYGAPFLRAMRAWEIRLSEDSKRRHRKNLPPREVQLRAEEWLTLVLCGSPLVGGIHTLHNATMICDAADGIPLLARILFVM
jgi:hypothetical protein